MKILRLSLLLSLAMIAGCYTITPTDYPSTWAPLDTGLGPGCDSIVGTYQNSGKARGEISTKLTDWLIGWHKIVQDFQYLSIAYGQNKQIVVSGIQSPESTPVQLISIEKYKCNDAFLTINAKSSTFFIKGERRLYRSANYLVVESYESGFDIVMLIPVSGTESNWARFPKYESKQ